MCVLILTYVQVPTVARRGQQIPWTLELQVIAEWSTEY